MFGRFSAARARASCNRPSAVWIHAGVHHELERDVAMQLRVASAKHHAHATFAHPLDHPCCRNRSPGLMTTGDYLTFSIVADRLLDGRTLLGLRKRVGNGEDGLRNSRHLPASRNRARRPAGDTDRGSRW